MRTRRVAPFVATFLLGTVVVAGLAAYVEFSGTAKVPDSERRASPQVRVDRDALQTKPDTQAFVPMPVFQGEETRFEFRKVSVPVGEEPRAYVVQEFVRGTGLFGADLRVLTVEVKDGVAHVHFNSGFRQEASSDQEALIVNGIARALGQFSGVDKFLLYADGQQIEGTVYLQAKSSTTDG